MERAEGFLEGGLGVVVVVVEDVDVVEPKASQTLIEARHEVLPRAEVAIWSRPHVPTGLGGNHELVAVVTEVVVKDPGEIALGAAVGGSVVVGQVEMGDAQVESSTHGGALGVEGPVVTEVLPQPERHGGQEEAAPPTTAVGHGPVAIFGGMVAGHVTPAPSLCWPRIYSNGCNRATGPRTPGGPRWLSPTSCGPPHAAGPIKVKALPLLPRVPRRRR